MPPLTVLLSHGRAKFHVRMAEWMLGFAMFGAGLQLARPLETFALGPYVYIRQIADEQSWAIAFILIGALRLLVLIINGSMPRGSPHLRGSFAAVCGVIWALLAVEVFASGVPSLLFPFCSVFLVAEFINTFRAFSEAGSEDAGGGNARGSR